ncbi:MAG: ABC transporter ATP-binding protein [bacterium]|nr:ABC transporter ATP-binding protein [bacterium]MDE0417161.1 ABC transporter ATP-binding protein [bacterium]
MSDGAVLVDLRGVSKTFGTVTAVHPLQLRIAQGEFLAILGPSGCGKTTLLRLIGGFLLPTAGTVHIGGKDMTRLGPEHRPTNMVFQGYGLFPHMTVAQNIAYGLRVAKVSRVEIDHRVGRAMDLVHLEGLADRPVTNLSGGQQQRVALARALIMRPDALLLDEPLAALDLKLRKAMQEELRRIHASTGGTFVFVTHDQEEAMGLATRICVMEGGHIVQDGRPEEIYNTPTTQFVSTFIGEANIMPGQRSNGRVILNTGIAFADSGAEEAVVSIIRPEKMSIATHRDDQTLAGCDAYLSGRLLDAIFRGPHVHYSVAINDKIVVTIDSRDMDMRRRLSIGDDVVVAWRFDDQRILTDR